MERKLHFHVTLVLFVFFITAMWFQVENSFVNIPSSSRATKAIAQNEIPLSQALQKQGLRLGDPVFIRILKTSSQTDKTGYLEVFVENAQGKFKLFKTWEICKWSGQLGPKLKQGDGQSPEGFYFIKPQSLNPNSAYHLSFNLGYPNTYDRAHNRTGDYLMVHGQCVSIGCYAMTDKGIEEIYTLIHNAMKNGQPYVRVHSFPFPMTEGNLTHHQNSTQTDFWRNLQQGWNWFETHERPPNVNVKNKRYTFGFDK